MTDFVMTRELTLSRGGYPAGVSSSSSYRVMVVRDGHGTVSLSGRVADVTAGAVMLLAPYDLLYIPEQTAKDLDAYLFTFTREGLYRIDVTLSDVFAGESYRHPAVQSDAMAALVARMDDILPGGEGQREAFARLRLTELILHLAASPMEFDASAGVARAARYLRDHLHEDVTLDALSDTVGISKFYLCRAFSRDSGLTPHAYLNHLRAYRAEALLAGGMSAADAAVSVGFGDYSTFFRTYRKIIGRTPATRDHMSYEQE